MLIKRFFNKEVQQLRGFMTQWRSLTCDFRDVQSSRITSWVPSGHPVSVWARMTICAPWLLAHPYLALAVAALDTLIAFPETKKAVTVAMMVVNFIFIIINEASSS